MSSYALAQSRRAQRRTLVDSVTFKDRQGVVKAGPWPCKVLDFSIKTPTETTDGTRLTGGKLFEIVLEHGRTVEDHWRGFVTFAETGQEVEYHVRGMLGPSTYEVQRSVIVERVR